MDETRNSKKDAVFFTQTARGFFVLLKVPMFTNKKEALDFVRAYDGAVDELAAHMKESGNDYSAHTILLFGSVLGEAFKYIFGGEWSFSEKQGRWTVLCQTQDASDVEMNVFHEVEKRIDNGMKSSIGGYFESIEKIFRIEF